MPELSDVASDQQVTACKLNVDVDREKASRLNVLTQAIDDTLYDAFGQRQVSIIFTQLNQFRVILEVEPQFRESPDVARQDLREIDQRPAGSAQRLCNHAREQHAALDSAPGTISRGDYFVQSRTGNSLGQGDPAIQKAEREIGLPDTIATTFTGAAAEFRSS